MQGHGAEQMGIRERVRQKVASISHEHYGRPPRSAGETLCVARVLLGHYGVMALHLVKGRYALRKCQRGRWPRVQGRVIVNAKGPIRIGDFCDIKGHRAPTQFSVSRNAALDIGDETFINTGTLLSATRSITIGRGCRIGNDVLIMDSDFHNVDVRDAEPKGGDIVIGDGVWLAARVIVLKGVHIGEGAVVAAGAVVTRDVPAYCLAAGVPARVIRQLDTCPVRLVSTTGEDTEACEAVAPPPALSDVA